MTTKYDICIPMLSLSPHGGNRVLIELANKLVNSGHEVLILTSRVFLESTYKIDSNVKIKFVGGKTKLSYFSVLFFSCFLKNKIIIANYFLTFYSAVFSKLIFGSKYVYLVQDIESEFFHGWKRRFADFICNLSYKSSVVISANSYLSGKIIKRGGVPSLTVNVGVADSFFISTDSFDDLTKEFDILYFARAQVHKRLDLFLELMLEVEKLLPEVRILCISQDMSALELIRNTSVTKVKPLDDYHLCSLIKKSKINILTSDHEGFALPPLECMSQGVPLAYFPCGGPSVYVSENNSICLDRNNIKKSAENIVFLLKNENMLKHFSESSIITAEKFKLSTAIDDIVNYIDDTYFVNL